MAEAEIVSHAFSPADLVGGDAALDFINTMTGRDLAPRDWLDSYARLLEWAALAALLPPATLKKMALRAKAHPAGARAALARAKQFREALFSLVTAIIAGTPPAEQPLALLRKYWIAGTAMLDLTTQDGQVVAAPATSCDDLDFISAMVACRMMGHVLPLPRQRLRICQGPNCSWLFIDRSKGGQRCWCDMAVCGNAAKARRFQSAKKAS